MRQNQTSWKGMVGDSWHGIKANHLFVMKDRKRNSNITKKVFACFFCVCAILLLLLIDSINNFNHCQRVSKMKKGFCRHSELCWLHCQGIKVQLLCWHNIYCKVPYFHVAKIFFFSNPVNHDVLNSHHHVQVCPTTTLFTLRFAKLSHSLKSQKRCECVHNTFGNKLHRYKAASPHLNRGIVMCIYRSSNVEVFKQSNIVPIRGYYSKQKMMTLLAITNAGQLQLKMYDTEKCCLYQSYY